MAEDAPLAALIHDDEDRALLSGVIRRVAARRAERVVTLRIPPNHCRRPGLPARQPLRGQSAPLCAGGVNGTRQARRVSHHGQEAFGLTVAEVEVVRGGAPGLSWRDIAEARGRAPETVRAQVRSVLAKTETHSEAALVRVVPGLMDVPLIAVKAALAIPAGGTLEPCPVHERRAPDGRRLT